MLYVECKSRSLYILIAVHLIVTCFARCAKLFYVVMRQAVGGRRLVGGGWGSMS